MREPVLYLKHKKQLRLYKKVEVLKEKYVDREVYVPVDKPGYYLIVFFVKPFNKPVGERVLMPHYKIVKKKSGTYQYLYLRIPLPWSNKLRQRSDVMELEIRIYKLGRRLGEHEYYSYLSEMREQYRYLII